MSKMSNQLGMGSSFRRNGLTRSFRVATKIILTGS